MGCSSSPQPSRTSTPTPPSPPRWAWTSRKRWTCRCDAARSGKESSPAGGNPATSFTSLPEWPRSLSRAGEDPPPVGRSAPGSGWKGARLAVLFGWRKVYPQRYPVRQIQSIKVTFHDCDEVTKILKGAGGGLAPPTRRVLGGAIWLDCSEHLQEERLFGVLERQSRRACGGLLVPERIDQVTPQRVHRRPVSEQRWGSKRYVHARAICVRPTATTHLILFFF